MENQNTNRPFLAAMDAVAFLASSESSTLIRPKERQTILVWLLATRQQRQRPTAIPKWATSL
jgi:hypothetical protein